jgi:Xaa-Pro aminopeptidase
MKANKAPSSSSFAPRLAKVRERLAAERLDALLVSSLPNVQYLTGFSGTESGDGVVLLTQRNSILFTDSRYDLQAHEEVRDSQVKIVKGGALANAAKWSRRSRERRLGFEGDAISFGTSRKLRELLPQKRLVAVSGLVEKLRMVKDEEEIEQIRKAVDAGSRAFSETLGHLRIGMSELEVAAEIEYHMRLCGAERPAFESIVAFGDRSALPHARPGTRQLKANEFILMDLGAILGGYAGDMTRTVFMGTAPRKAKDIYGAVLEAQLAAEETVKEGVQCSAVDGAARRVLQRHGYAQYFTHSTGHGVGREIHEAPRIAAKQNVSLPERAVITVEPGVYIPGYGGVRIEDVVVVRKHGAEVLTATPKELTVL